MTNIKVSIIVAVYNIEKLIDRCIISLLNQSIKDIEIILVNDASTDNSLDICEKYKCLDERIIVIDKQSNSGLSEARNTGIHCARGEYIAFVDGDDYVDRETYEKAYEHAKLDDSDIVIFGAYYKTINNKYFLMPISSKHNKYIGNEINDILMYEVIGTLPEDNSDYAVGFSPWGKILRTKFIKENNISFISERKLLYEDLIFVLNSYPLANIISVLNEPLYYYCENKSSLTRKIDLSRFNRLIDMYVYIINTNPYKNILLRDDEMVLRFKRTMISYIRLCVIQASGSLKTFKYIKHICNNLYCREIIHDYPYRKLPINQMIFLFFLKSKLYVPLFIICKIKR